MRNFFSFVPQINESLTINTIPSKISLCNNQIQNDILYLFPSHERKDIFKQPSKKSKSKYEEYILSQKRKQTSLIFKSISDKMILNFMMKKKKQLNDYITLTLKEENNDISYLKCNLKKKIKNHSSNFLSYKQTSKSLQVKHSGLKLKSKKLKPFSLCEYDSPTTLMKTLSTNKDSFIKFKSTTHSLSKKTSGNSKGINAFKNKSKNTPKNSRTIFGNARTFLLKSNNFTSDSVRLSKLSFSRNKSKVI